MKKLKGFTLVELVIVIAILGVLSSVAIPNLFGQTKRAKYNTSHKQAESVFNSAQTIAQKYETIDRAIKDDTQKTFAGSHRYSNIDGVSQNDTSAYGSEAGNFVEKLKSMNTHLNECKWVVDIKDYKVIHVMWAENETDGYVGVYCACGNSSHAADYDHYVKEPITDKIKILSSLDTEG